MDNSPIRFLGGIPARTEENNEVIKFGMNVKLYN